MRLIPEPHDLQVSNMVQVMRLSTSFCRGRAGFPHAGMHLSASPTAARLIAFAACASLLPSAAGFGIGGASLLGLHSARPARLGRFSPCAGGLAMSGAPPPTAKEMAREIERRRTFAIISHPDAGKTTMTEKLLL